MKKLITVADILDYIRSHRIKYKHPFTTGFNTGLDAIESFITGEPVVSPDEEQVFQAPEDWIDFKKPFASRYQAKKQQDKNIAPAVAKILNTSTKDCPRCNGTMLLAGIRWVCMNCDHHEKEK